MADAVRLQHNTSISKRAKGLRQVIICFELKTHISRYNKKYFRL